MIVGTGQEIETHSGEVARDSWIGDKWNVVDPVVGMPLELANIENRCFEVAVGRVGALEKLDGLRELWSRPAYWESEREMMQSPTAMSLKLSGTLVRNSWASGRLGSNVCRVFDAGIGGILGGGREWKARRRTAEDR